MLKKNLNALRDQMRSTFACDQNDGYSIKNWMLPYNHLVSMTQQSQNLVKTLKACKKLETPFDASLLNEEVGGPIFLQKN